MSKHTSTDVYIHTNVDTPLLTRGKRFCHFYVFRECSAEDQSQSSCTRLHVLPTGLLSPSPISNLLNHSGHISHDCDIHYTFNLNWLIYSDYNTRTSQDETYVLLALNHFLCQRQQQSLEEEQPCVLAEWLE